MSLCSKCRGLDLVAALRRAQGSSGPRRSKNDGGHGVVGGWYTFGRDVFASALLCELCSLVCQGWRKWRLKVVREAMDDNIFDPSDPPEDLNDDIEDMDIYLGGKTSFDFLRRKRYCSEGRKWNYVLAVTCTKVGNQGSWEVHDPLVAELRITHAEDETPGELADFGLGVTVCKDPMSTLSVSIAKDWLGNCVLNHESCLSKAEAVSLPTRFLDICDRNDNDHIFLRERGDEEDRRYVALSHCWGTTRPLCLTSATLETHKQGILVQSLPRTFRDAVTIIRALGLRYIWIDSLCIVQDDAEDWRREAGRMAGVYRDAHLVLSATRASSDEEGFLGTRPRLDHIAFPIESSDNPLVLKLLSPRSQGEESGIDTHVVADEPLSRRAWCLQERYLARRILHYGTQQMIWECGTVRAAEDGDFGSIVGDQLGRLKQSAILKTTVFNTRERDVEGYAEWYAMIEDYTGRGITRDSDRLPALLGLRVALESEVNDTYLAGIWLKGLLEGLIWCTASSDKPLVRPDGPAAPSWTWASVKGTVRFPIYSWFNERASWKVPNNFEPMADYISHSYTMNDGVATPSELRLAAPVVVIRDIKPRTEEPPDSEAILGSPPERSTVACRIFYFRDLDQTGEHREFWIDGSFDIKEEENTIDPSDLHIVFLSRLPFIFEEPDFLEHRFGLLLARQRETGNYKRVGYVDGCLLREDVIAAFPREEGDTVDAPEINSLAPDPLCLERQQVTII
ncbi:hypothetical protein GQX73_g7357 [Xylaria multiplex]|uniref:Heterokaryon incompatibility domain-containing protein n=1 Tax=Xylaria multiplex TaxID=323545 RepID=A0A7C8IRB5_9PEZI|nr:hypothetical protein GQX73_g7357 [Xylaria multiplex]